VKLTTDIFAVDQYVTYFIPDELAVGFAFQPGMIGIKEVIVAGLGVPPNWLAVR